MNEHNSKDSHLSLPPCSLYIHLPWCISKCPYCDFNSHALRGNLPEDNYINALIEDLLANLALIQARPLISIFFGGGTPSLFSGAAINNLLSAIAANCTLDPEIEITLEANPGSLSLQELYAYQAAGINRLSIGLQTCNDTHLATLGRAHNSATGIASVKLAQDAGYTNINVDIMYGLPAQSVAEAEQDLIIALSLGVPHISWYQLTIEPNTRFYRYPPSLPTEAVMSAISDQGPALLHAHNFQQYEVSAYSRPGNQCQHNLNYWQFGDYLGIGAGAHSKITTPLSTQVTRHQQPAVPGVYMATSKQAPRKILTEAELIFEFMLNALRLTHGISLQQFTERTGIPASHMQMLIDQAQTAGFITIAKNHLYTTALGRRFLNDLIAIFLC